MWDHVMSVRSWDVMWDHVRSCDVMWAHTYSQWESQSQAHHRRSCGRDYWAGVERVGGHYRIFQQFWALVGGEQRQARLGGCQCWSGRYECLGSVVSVRLHTGQRDSPWTTVRERGKERRGGGKLVTLIQVVALELSTCRSGIACTCLKYGKHKPQSPQETSWKLAHLKVISTWDDPDKVELGQSRVAAGNRRVNKRLGK